MTTRLLTKGLAAKYTSAEVHARLVADDWDPVQRFFLDYQAAERIFGRRQKPVTVYYEDLPWFVFLEPGILCFHHERTD